MNAIICVPVLRDKNGGARTRNAVKTQARIFTEKMQTVSRDIPGLMTSRDTVLCRLNIVHGIIVNFADRISPPKPYRNARPITCKKFGCNISCCSSRKNDRRFAFALHTVSCTYFSFSEILSLYMHLISVNDYLEINYKTLH